MMQVDLLLTGGAVVTMDSERHVFAPGAVAVSGSNIVAVGPADEVAAHCQAHETWNCANQVIVPGLINTHTHMPMSLLRGLADDLRLDVWLHGYILPTESRFVNPEFCRLGTLLSCAELIRGGVTTFADMYYFEDDIAWAAVEAGLRGVCGQTVMIFPTPDAASYDASLRYCAEFLDHWQGHDLITAAPAPHSPYMCTADILQETVRLATSYGVPLLIHIAETALEVQESIEQKNRTPVRWLEQVGLFQARVVAAHCVHINNEDMHILGQHGVGIAHNPTSNLKLASGFAPVIQMLEHRLAVGLGTDGTASNNDLDMWSEMHIAALLPKALANDPTALPAQRAFAMATIEGARALHMDHLIGSLEPGKRADIAVLDMDRVHTMPRFETTGQNIYSRLVYATKSSDVRHTLVNGRVLMRDRQLLTVDESAALAQAAKLAAKINVFFVRREKDVLNKLLAIGGLAQEETYEVQVKARLPHNVRIETLLEHPEIHVTRHSERDQYDTYFLFDDPTQGRIRYREDNVIVEGSQVAPIYNLVYTGPVVEQEYENSVVLTRARYASRADRSPRFYAEYFQPQSLHEVIKHRHRYHIRYKGTLFFINLDEIIRPPQECFFVEIKSRTWSSQDAMRKAILIGELLELFEITPENVVRQDYTDLK